MKLLILTSPLLTNFVTVSAEPYQNSTLMQDFANEIDSEPQLRKFSNILTMVYSQLDTSYSQSSINSFMRNYGCFCFQDGSKAIGGQGKPVDRRDRLCKKLYQCKKCIKLDFSDPNVSCDPDYDAYDMTVSVSQSNDGNIDNFDITCNDEINSCKRTTCECDKAFAVDFATTWDDDNYDLSLWYNNRNVKIARKEGRELFDKENVCQKINKNSQKASCCGEGLERKPYNDFLQDCCSDGQARSVGTCP